MRVTSWIAVLVILCTWSWAASAAPAYKDGAQAFVRAEYARAREVWQPLAEANDPRAQYGLALLYANGLGVERNALRAQHFYTRAAERGHPGAQYNLAVMRDTGNGVPRDAAQAAFWYGEAAGQGMAAAAYNLALMTLAGDGLRRDPAKAVAWLDRARPMDRAQLIAELPLARVAVSSANIRATPSLSADIVGHAAYGHEMRVFARRGDWAEVWLVESGAPDTVGWIAARLLDGLPQAGAKRVRLDRFEFGPLVDLNARHVQRPNTEPATIPTTTTTTAAAQTRRPRATNGNGRLLRNSGWLVALDSVDFGDKPIGQPVRVATDVLNVRAAPSTAAPIITRVGRGDVVQITERRSGWRRIHLPGRAGSGWVASFLLANYEPPVDDDIPGRAVRMGADAVNLRAAPSTSARVLGKLSRGEPVRVIDSKRGWREILMQGKDPRSGWVAAFLIAGESARQRPVSVAVIGESGG